MENEDARRKPEPATRSLAELVRALEIVQEELGFQVHRLNEHVRPRTEAETDYHENLKEGYGKARYWIGILHRYHKGRLDHRSGKAPVVAEVNEADVPE